MDDLISRQQAVDALADYIHNVDKAYSTGKLSADDCRDAAQSVLDDLPSAQPEIMDDGTLWIKSDKLKDIKRVIVEDGRMYCKQFYEDAEPDIIRCKDCKHWIPYDWMFSEVWQSKNIADYPEDDIGCDCSEMAMKANDFCSRAERKTE